MKQTHAEYYADVDRLYREAQERADARAKAYWAKAVHEKLTEEQERERNKQRNEVARWARCDVRNVYWHGPDQCWSFR